MITIELTDKEALQFKEFRKLQSEIENYHKNWNQVMQYSKMLGNGSFTMTIQNGVPVRIERSMQKVVLGVIAT